MRRVPVGWAVASWLVSHAGSFKIRFVGYDGYEWTAAQGRKGWVKQKAASQPGTSQPGTSQPGASQPGTSPPGAGPHGASPSAVAQNSGCGQVPTGQCAVVFG